MNLFMTLLLTHLIRDPELFGNTPRMHDESLFVAPKVGVNR